ncbi:eCIS core domain-containing protein [Celerinatantimonas diazotrophica]|uniref:Uncharacterized protein DUF4157 n=1 Tax=Celerinatantimonas diazotrophica TaxID=412034 RepID=A0A4R1JA26_9GAMM|nr:DUF4157 domain-containing protein [Celerinatantimonas diazotrophica]TCK47380.1 uncharacterized protein DUF4157 [Celerinatantimonas diazotrophica]CAG9295002.1 hypothetical protein CEDIAZO_00108 [Celerinatantimonas diazotrophica]
MRHSSSSRTPGLDKPQKSGSASSTRPLQAKQLPAPTIADQRQETVIQKQQIKMMHHHTQLHNNTGLPDDLKEGMEQLSGFNLNHVRVHHNSSEPSKIGAAAFAQGHQIYMGQGQDQHLPHELAHVVQQMQGRVATTTQYQGLNINDDDALEQEATDWGHQALAYAAQNQSTQADESSPLPSTSFLSSSSLMNQDHQPIQAVWLFYDTSMDSTRRIFWHEDRSPQARGQIPAPPTIWQNYQMVDESNVGDYYRADYTIRPSRSSIPAYTLSEYNAIYCSTNRRNTGDVYNPFGRFDSESSVTSFIPNSRMGDTRKKELAEYLASKEKSFQKNNSEATQELWEKIKEDYKAQGKIISDRNQWGYPPYIVTVGRRILPFIGCTDFGAHYSDHRPVEGQASPNFKPKSDPNDLKWAQGVTSAGDMKEAVSKNISTDVIESFEGKKRIKSQNEVMGMSACVAAENAGFDPNEGNGWEWLHMIAHSMGGIDLQGPQVSENLVAGTSECNTQMIVVEEFLKDIVKRIKGHAHLHVMATMFDAERHIGQTIRYDFSMYDEHSTPLSVYHWVFDCLSRSKPLVSENRQLRYAGRTTFGALDAKNLSSYQFGENPFQANSDAMIIESPANKLTPRELAHFALNIPKERRAAIAEAFGLESSQTSQQHIYDLLAVQDQETVLDVVRSASIKVPDDKQIYQNVDRNLAEMGLYRTPSDTTGFICLIDSIYQALLKDEIKINRQDLINEVRRLTGTNQGDMLEIINPQGNLVLEAVQNVIFSNLRLHVDLDVDIFLVMPNGFVVQFLNANERLVANSTKTVSLRLLFINNNHYEPLFDNA